jgi:hypothetical protein
VLGVWLRLFGYSCGAAIAAVAAQLGVAQALRIISWDEIGTAESWRTALTWTAFMYLVAVLCGAAIGRALSRRRGRGGGAGQTVGARLGAAFAAAIGAGAATLLAWLPAHSARPPVSVHHELVVALTAGAGVAVGLILAAVALFVAPVAGSLRAAILYVWVLAIACIVTAVVGQASYAVPRLGIPDAPSMLPAAWWTGPYVLIAAAVLLGAVVALVARWGGAARGGVAISGLAGPAAIAIPYLIPGQTLAGEGLAPLIAMGAGLATSALIALPPHRQRSDSTAGSMADRRTRDASAATEPPPFSEPPPFGEPDRSTSHATPSWPPSRNDAASRNHPPRQTEPPQAEPARQAEPAKLAAPARQAEPAKRAEPARQTEPARQAQPAKRAEPATQAEPARQAEPAKRAGPHEEAEPSFWASSPVLGGAGRSEPTAWNGPTSASPSARERNPLPAREPVAATPVVPAQRTGRGQTYGSGAVYGTPPVQPAPSIPVGQAAPAAPPPHGAAPVVAKASVSTAAPVMGRPPRTADEEYAEWRRDSVNPPTK